MKTLLIVDDEPVVRALVAASLEGEWQVAAAADGTAALALALERQPDVILLDVSLPGITGPEVLGRLRSVEATASIPVLYLTGLPPEPGHLADGVLTKPFTPASLRSALASALLIATAADLARRAVVPL